MHSAAFKFNFLLKVAGKQNAECNGLSKEKYSKLLTKECCDIHGIEICKFKISSINNLKVTFRQSIFLCGKKTPNKHPKKV